MQTFVLKLCFYLIIVVNTGCGFHLKNVPENQVIISHLKTIMMNSYDPYGPLTRAIRTELHLNNISIVENTEIKNNMLSSLHIIEVSEKKMNTLILQDGEIAEYYIVLNIHAQILRPGKDKYPINIKIYHSVFNHSLTTLAKDIESDSIQQDIYKKAAQKLVRKILTIFL